MLFVSFYFINLLLVILYVSVHLRCFYINMLYINIFNKIKILLCYNNEIPKLISNVQRCATISLCLVWVITYRKKIRKIEITFHGLKKTQGFKNPESKRNFCNHLERRASFKVLMNLPLDYVFFIISTVNEG